MVRKRAERAAQGALSGVNGAVSLVARPREPTEQQRITSRKEQSIPALCRKKVKTQVEWVNWRKVNVLSTGLNVEEEGLGREARNGSTRRHQRSGP